MGTKEMAFPQSFFIALLLICFSLRSLSVELPLLSTDPDIEALHRSQFPNDFIFGASTAAYQVEGAVREGGRGVGIWDNWANSGQVSDNSNADVTGDQYHRYEEDVGLLAAMNMDAYRFSISWTRIFPDGYGPSANPEGIAYYNRLIDTLLSRGIIPYVTIYHWDLPQALQDAFGGWIDRQIVDHFVLFAETCFAAFGDRVKNWFTINEPGLYARCAYDEGKYPPGRDSSPGIEVYIVAHNFLLAHGAAVDVYRKKFQMEQQGVIGITLDCIFAAPVTDSPEDQAAAQRRNEFQLGWFLDPIYFGDYPDSMRQNVGSRLPRFSSDEIALLHGSTDFIGLNHYTSRWVTSGPGPLPNATSSSYFLDQHVQPLFRKDGIIIGAQAASEWLFVVPWGFTGVLKWTSARYNAPIYVAENGMDYAEELPLEESLRDSRRVDFFQQYLAAALQAIREGVDLRGYFVWSLLDNWEWVAGFTKRFGIIYVDYNDGQKRYPKDSAFWFQSFLQRRKTNYSDS